MERPYFNAILFYDASGFGDPKAAAAKVSQAMNEMAEVINQSGAKEE